MLTDNDNHICFIGRGHNVPPPNPLDVIGANYFMPIKNPEFTVLHSEGHNKGEKNA